MNLPFRLLNRFRIRGLRAKLLLPIAGLMVFSLALSTLVFVGGTALTRNRLLDQRLDQDTRRLTQILAGRTAAVESAARVMAADPDINAALQQKTEASLAEVDARAVVVRNRFNLDLVQIYDRRGDAWVNLVTSGLYRVSSLLDATKGDAVQVIVFDDRLLLVGRASAADGGTVIAGIDLGSELERIARNENITSLVGLRLDGTGVTSQPGLSFSDLLDQNQHLARQMSLPLGGQELTLVISQPTTEIDRVTQTGLWVVVLASILTASLLVFLGSRLVDLLLHPIQDLAAISEQVASRRDFTIAPSGSRRLNLLRIGQDDEIGQLESSFQQMLAELRDFYQDLESKVEARTRQITTAAEIARAATSSLDLDRVLRTAVEEICSQFDYYFAGVFIIDGRSEIVSLRQAAGMATIENEIKRIDLPLSTPSLITTAINRRETLIVQDVSKSSLYLPLVVLPDTRSEAVFPLVHAGMVIGALDIQSDKLDAFPPEIIHTFETLAVQIAIAVQNAIVYDRQRTLTRRLAEIDHLKAQLLDTMSHELRTPLNSIIGFSKIILKGLDGEITEAQRVDLTSILESGQHLLRMINDILDIAQFEAGEINLDLRPINLRQEVLFVISRLQDELDKKRIRLEVDVPPNMPSVMADNVRIQQVLTNLLANAIKFTDAGKISISAASSDQWVVVTIEDTGIGIAPEDIGKLFQPFLQVDGSSTRRFGGIGLGLSIARYIVELHGGRIWAEGRPGVGSVFSFTLPLDPSVSRASAQMMDFKETRILQER